MKAINEILIDTGDVVYKPLDLSDDTKMTFNFVSNILSSIDKIQSSYSQTISIPYTLNNERILDLVCRPEYESGMRNRKIGCRYYRNGIRIIDSAYCYVMDSTDEKIEIVIVFGLMQNYKNWIEEDKLLRELIAYPNAGGIIPYNHGSIEWNANSGVSIWEGKASCYDYPNKRSMYFGTYDCGIALDSTTRQYCNIHPFVTLREVYEKIILDNSLNFNFPTEIKNMMENLALVLTPMDKNVETTTLTNITLRNLTFNPIENNYYLFINSNGDFVFGNKTLMKVGDKVEVDFGTIMITGGTYVNAQQMASAGVREFPMVIHYYDGSSDEIIYPTVCKIDYNPNGTNQGVTYSFVYDVGSRSFGDTYEAGDKIVEMYIRPGKTYGDAFYVGHKGSTPLTNVPFGGKTIDYKSTSLNQSAYPNAGWYRMIPNLPNISQLSYIKALCHMFGLFPVVNDTEKEQIDFVPFETITINKYKALDWSDKLIDADYGTAKKISFSISDYKARKNRIAYKTDDKEINPHESVGYLNVDSDILDAEANLLEFPWSASDGDKITQYQMNEDNDGVNFTECNHRVMHIKKSGNTYVLDFTSDLETGSLLSTYYSQYQDMIKKPVVITERLVLNEMDVRDVDFTVPVYLRKYGRYYAIKSIKIDSSDIAEAELLQLN